MAKQASAEQVQKDMRQPNYSGSVKLIRTSYAKKDKIAEINGQTADIFAKASDGCGVNRKAAKIFAGLDKMEPEMRQDVRRSLEGLIAAASWNDGDDLVDRAQDDDDDDDDTEADRANRVVRNAAPRTAPAAMGDEFDQAAPTVQ